MTFHMKINPINKMNNVKKKTSYYCRKEHESSYNIKKNIII